VSNQVTVFVDTGKHGFAGFETYFKHAKMVRMAPHDTDLAVTNVVPINGMSLTTLAAVMGSSLVKKGTNVLVYAHAQPTNFVFPVHGPGSKNHFDMKEAAKLSYHLDVLASGSSVLDPFLVQKYLPHVDPFHKTDFKDKSPGYMKVSKAVGEQLMDSLVAIREKKLNHLAIRACRVGQSTEFMQLLGRLFGVKRVSAPKLRTAAIAGPRAGIITVNPEAKAQFLQLVKRFQHGVNGDHVYTHPHPARHLGVTDPLVVQFTVVPAGKTTFVTSAFGASEPEAAFEFFRLTAGYTALPREVMASGVIAFHALQGPTSLIFPGEREYLQNMSFVSVNP
jgi:hypothetical protein